MIWNWTLTRYDWCEVIFLNLWAVASEVLLPRILKLWKFPSYNYFKIPSYISKSFIISKFLHQNSFIYFKIPSYISKFLHIVQNSFIYFKIPSYISIIYNRKCMLTLQPIHSMFFLFLNSEMVAWCQQFYHLILSLKFSIIQMQHN